MAIATVPVGEDIALWAGRWGKVDRLYIYFGGTATGLANGLYVGIGDGWKGMKHGLYVFGWSEWKEGVTFFSWSFVKGGEKPLGWGWWLAVRSSDLEMLDLSYAADICIFKVYFEEGLYKGILFGMQWLKMEEKE